MDVASKQQKTLKNVLYYGLPVLAILMIAVGWVLFSGSHPELMPAPADVWARFVKTFTKPIAKTSLAGHAWASLRRVLMHCLSHGPLVFPSAFSSDGIKMQGILRQYI